VSANSDISSLKVLQSSTAARRALTAAEGGPLVLPRIRAPRRTYSATFSAYRAPGSAGEMAAFLVVDVDVAAHRVFSGVCVCGAGVSGV
jgi:hypothetical protein